MWNTGRIIQVVIFISPFVSLQVLNAQGETSAGISIDVQIALNRSLASPFPGPSALPVPCLNLGETLEMMLGRLSRCNIQGV